ncbi:RNA-directed DNA polymerase, eukaryota [Tanacetum coccineum]
MGSFRTKEDDLSKISTSIYVSNFPETFTAKELFHACKQYGHVVDSFIPKKRSKEGKRFGFVRFINVFNTERLGKGVYIFDKFENRLLSIEGLCGPEDSIFGDLYQKIDVLKWETQTHHNPISISHDLLEVDDMGENCYHSRRVCVLTKLQSNIFESFKIVFKGKVCWLRAKEVTGWEPELVEEPDYEEEVNVNETNDNHSMQFPPGFTPVDMENASSANGEKSVNVNGGVDNDVPEGVHKSQQAKKDWVRELCVKHKVNFMTIQETKMENMELLSVRNCWGNYAFNYLHSNSVEIWEGILGINVGGGNSSYPSWTVYAPHDPRDKRMVWEYLAYVINQWNGNVVIMGDFNEGEGSDGLIQRRMDLIKDIQHLDQLHTMDLVQKTKIKWAIEGDENTRFFHGVLNKKRNQMAIRGVLVDGEWIDQPSEVKGEFFNHFRDRFDKIIFMTDSINLGVESGGIWDCGTDKSPGPDGFTFGFYRHFWSSIANDVYKAVNHFFVHGDIPNGCNPSFITLILKVPAANMVGVSMSRIQDWREVIDKVPSTVLKLMESIRGKFFNGHETGSRKASWIKWDKGNGYSTKFWYDCWYQGGILKNLCPRMFALETRKEVTVNEKMCEPYVSFSFRRGIRGGCEQDQYNVLEGVVNSVTLAPMEDRWVWSLESSVMVDALPTRLNLSRRGISIQSLSCPVCDVGVESSNHLFFRCEGVVSLIFDKAVLANHNCHVHARLCYDLITELPSFPSTEPGVNYITFKHLLLKKVQDTFDCSEGGDMGEFVFLIALHHQKVISDTRKGRLPVRVELDRRGIDLDLVLCASCNDSVETRAHCLVTCDLAMSVWTRLFNWWKVRIVSAFTIEEVFSHIGNVNVPTLYRYLASGNLDFRILHLEGEKRSRVWR